MTTLADWGVVLLHGKWDTAEGAVGPLREALEAAGARVRTPTCSWATRRFYDCGFEQALEEIADEAATLRAGGAQRILLAGHSLGANAALASASRTPPDALALVAPGHLPDRLSADGLTGDALAIARAARPGKRIPLPDFNQGQRRVLRFDPIVWLSYFDPDGAAVMPRSAVALDPSCPVLWASGRRDPLSSGGRAYAFDLLPLHPQNFWLELDAGHTDAPIRAASPLVAWLHSLDTTS